MSSYTIPTVIEATPKGERVSDIYSRLLSERIIFLGTPLDDGVANVIIAQLLHLTAERDDADINLYINSAGGSFSAMMAVYDTMAFVAPDVATLCVGQAMSTAALLLAAGESGKRAALPNARVLLHQPHSEGSQGSLSDLAIEAAELTRLRERSEAMLSHHTGRPTEQIRTDTERALVMTAAGAVEYGLIDLVLEPAPSGREQRGSVALRPDV